MIGNSSFFQISENAVDPYEEFIGSSPTGATFKGGFAMQCDKNDYPPLGVHVFKLKICPSSARGTPHSS
jgi:hypothetical protein